MCLEFRYEIDENNEQYDFKHSTVIYECDFMKMSKNEWEWLS